MKYTGNGDKLITDGDKRELHLSRNEPEAKNSRNFKIPSKKTISCTTPASALINALDETDKTIGVNIEKKYWYIDGVVKGLDNGSIKNVGTDAASLNYEILFSIQPDLVLMSNNDNFKMFSKLDEMDIPVAVFHDFLEKHPLGQAEWIKFIAAFYDKEKEANELFRRIEKNILNIKTQMSGVTKKPDVMWGTVYMKKAYFAGGDSFVSRLIDMTGGKYVFSDNKSAGDFNTSMEEFYLRGKEADIFISPTTKQHGTNSIDKLLTHSIVLKEFKSIKEGKVWCYQPWYWQSLDKVDEIVEDVAAILHPEMYPDHKLRYFDKLEWEHAM
ncbi:MAG: ABC transporter substrate-binding protein [Spirochaetes bacterium]|nr:ABC transporter substrate-binding protein [Spirochaetota bacterium]